MAYMEIDSDVMTRPPIPTYYYYEEEGGIIMSDAVNSAPEIAAYFTFTLPSPKMKPAHIELDKQTWILSSTPYLNGPLVIIPSRAARHIAVSPEQLSHPAYIAEDTKKSTYGIF